MRDQSSGGLPWTNSAPSSMISLASGRVRAAVRPAMPAPIMRMELGEGCMLVGCLVSGGGFYVSHPSQTARRMGHPSGTGCVREGGSRFYANAHLSDDEDGAPGGETAKD